MKFSCTRIFIILFLVIYGCNNNNGYKPPAFKEMGILKGEVLIHDVLCTHIWSIDIVDSLLILNCHNTLDNKTFYIYNKNTGEKIKAFGEIGDCPGELPASVSVSFDKVRNKIYAIGCGRIISYSIDSILNSNTYRFDSEIKEEKFENSKLIGHFKDSLFYSICNFRPDRNYRIAIIKPNGDIISRYSFLPKISRIDEKDTVFRFLYYSYKTLGALKPDASKLVLVTTCGLNLEIFNIVDNEIKLDVFLRYIKPKYLKTNPIRNDGIIEGISSVSSTDKYIYALWTKNTEKEFPKQLAIFNWKGEAIRRYNFDENIFAFTVSDDSDVYTVVKDRTGRLNVVMYKIN